MTTDSISREEFEAYKKQATADIQTLCKMNGDLVRMLDDRFDTFSRIARECLDLEERLIHKVYESEKHNLLSTRELMSEFEQNIRRIFEAFVGELPAEPRCIN